MEIPGKAARIIETLSRHGHEAYAVGGCVRDQILGRRPQDWDITTSARPQQVKALFPRTIDTGIAHGTVTVMLGGEGFEVTTYRVDGKYEDGRHPKSVEFTASLEEDLRRRDFTVNAMAYSPTAGLVDLFGGVRDLENGVLRCVGDPNERFREDALRILRAVRFAAQLGFSIEDGTQRAMARMSGSLSRISWERIRAELDKLLTSEHPEMLRLASEAGICRAVLPEFDAMLAMGQNNPHHIYSVGEHALHAVMAMRGICEEAARRWGEGEDAGKGGGATMEALRGRASRRDDGKRKTYSILCWTMLLHDVGKLECRTRDGEGIDHFYGHAERGEGMARAILGRLRFDHRTIDMAARLIRWHGYSFEPDEGSVRRAVSKIGADACALLFLAQRADAMAKSPDALGYLGRLERTEEIFRKVLKEGQCVTKKDLAVNGRDLLALGYESGKELGEALDFLLDRVLEDPARNERETLLALARERLTR